MELSAIQAVGAIGAPERKAETAAGAEPPDFAKWLEQQVQVADREIRTADREVQKLAVGESDNLHQVMLSLERARLSLDLIVQVRNRLLEAYQDIQRMQV